MAKIAYLECTRCHTRVSALQPQTVCPNCAGSLFVRYDMASLKVGWKRESLAAGPKSMWRYAEALPEVPSVTLGEGFTPMLPSHKIENVFIKDEGLNPTGTFKARGLSMAVSALRTYGIRKVAMPSAGNAASALAAYCAAAGMEAHIFMPQDVPLANRVECESYGAHVTLVNGLIGDCARMVVARQAQVGWFDISTMKEPFRVEGKKTMGYEIGEQLGWTLPDAVIYPCGGGVGLIGMWKAFDEMEELGWIGAARPKMIAVQAEGCAPVVRAFTEGKSATELWSNAHTLAAGLRVPKPYADHLILDIVRKSGGTAVAVSDVEIMAALREWARDEGVFAAPEGAASLAAYHRLRASGFLRAGERVVLFNTGSGLKYIDVIGGTRESSALPAGRAIGGIIQPY